MQSSQELTPKLLKDKLDTIRNYIVTGFDEVFESYNVYQKYLCLKKEYNSLCILDDVNILSGESLPIKLKLYDINENIYGGNIHYEYTDKFYNKR